MMNILIVEDEHAINELIKMSLTQAGYRCQQAHTGMEAIALIDRQSFDLVLLDVNLPDIDGFSLHRHLGDVPVVYVTARDEIGDRLQGFQCGAEDYILKPFDLQELLARVKVAGRRHGKEPSCVRIGEVVVEVQRREVTVSEEPVNLSNREFELLRALMDHKNMALTREQLLRLAWGDDYEGDLRTVDVHIRRLREKCKLERQIVTVYKTGYKLKG